MRGFSSVLQSPENRAILRKTSTPATVSIAVELIPVPFGRQGLACPLSYGAGPSDTSDGYYYRYAHCAGPACRTNSGCQASPGCCQRERAYALEVALVSSRPQ